MSSRSALRGRSDDPERRIDLHALDIRPEHVALLEAIGVEGAHDLARHNVTILTAHVAHACEGWTGARLGPASEHVAGWVMQARSLVGPSGAGP